MHGFKSVLLFRVVGANGRQLMSHMFTKTLALSKLLSVQLVFRISRKFFYIRILLGLGLSNLRDISEDVERKRKNKEVFVSSSKLRFLQKTEESVLL